MVREVNTEVNAVEPPLEAVPLTTRSALLLCVVTLVQPVGAAVCINIAAVSPGIIPSQAAPPVTMEALRAAMAVFSGSASLVLMPDQVMRLVESVDPSSDGGLEL